MAMCGEAHAELLTKIGLFATDSVETPSPSPCVIEDMGLQRASSSFSLAPTKTLKYRPT